MRDAGASRRLWAAVGAAHEDCARRPQCISPDCRFVGFVDCGVSLANLGIVARLVLINGAPGSGKSTLADALAQRAPLSLALDIDQIKHALGGWEEDPNASGLHARRLALAIADEQLASGRDVFVGQYLARTDFIEALQDFAVRRSASFHEFILDLDIEHLALRLAGRADFPSRPEHTINGRLVGPGDSARLVQSLADLRASRPAAIWVDANGTPERTLAAIVAALG
ncbi:AAA family ATPase [Sinomonas sp. JGH33]|uniref:AAA family ATPase n=1 Tax=Sinomonas terricola TaxID=3110330 RepID=A0ABU5T9C3_9MICC|nr:AAA family ATPase [Sinomonas sp. JGH33]MEA5456117.1 AAA family ATPase [Sinomonas sp. JGH33]